MKGRRMVRALTVTVLALVIVGCGREKPIDVDRILSQPKAYVGSKTCKICHLEHFDSWQMTLHAKMLQDAKQNEDAVIAPIDDKAIREDLAKLGDKLKIPVDKIYVPKPEEILYTIGSQWNQRYLVKRNDTLYVAPIQYNAETGRWFNYNEDKWDKAAWIVRCGGCHATGVDLEKQTFVEPGIGCEACHGKGSWHAALPKTGVFQKRQTIVNPSKLTMGVAVQICGSCHSRGASTRVQDCEWPVGYEPGKALTAYYTSTHFPVGDVRNVYAEEFAKGHHQQYTDWTVSQHYREGVTCTSCHYVHQIGMPPTRSQTLSAGSKQCFECHRQVNRNLAHSIHSFANCVGCHMPRIAFSKESGDLHSHVFVALLPRDTLNNVSTPNSCQTCHKHKDSDFQKLQEQYEALAKIPRTVIKSIEPFQDK